MTQPTQTQSTALAPKQDPEKPMEYVPYGAQDTIKLSLAIVRDFIAVPTRKGNLPDKKDCMKFMMLCRARRLNPFEGDAFLIGYDPRDGGPAQWSLITGHQTYLKRAEIHPLYNGMKSGIILLDQNGNTVDREGDFHLENEEVVGGWATVYCKQREYPTHRRLRLARFAKNYGVWADDPAGMIVKCAEADALRSTFATVLGGLYMREEIDIASSMMPTAAMEIPASRLVEIRSEAPAPPAADQPKDEPGAAPAAIDKKNGPKGPKGPREELTELLTANSLTFEHLKMWGVETGNMEANVNTIAEIPEKDVARWLKAKTGLVNSLLKAKESVVPQ